MASRSVVVTVCTNCGSASVARQRGSRASRSGQCPVCAALWRCEECREPWTIGKPQCQRCGNRTREVSP